MSNMGQLANGRGIYIKHKNRNDFSDVHGNCHKMEVTVTNICVIFLLSILIQIFEVNGLEEQRHPLFAVQEKQKEIFNHLGHDDATKQTLSRVKRQFIYDYDPYYYRYRRPYPIPIPIIVGGGFIGRGFGVRGFGGRGFGGRGFGGRGFGGKGFGGRGFGGRGIGGIGGRGVGGIGGGRGGRG